MVVRAAPDPEEIPRSIKARLLRATPWRRPWKPDAVRQNVTVTRWPVWVRNLKERPGVYLIRDTVARDMIYVGRGRSVKDALLRHFHAWGPDRDRPHRRVVFDREAVEVKVYFVREGWLASVEADLIALHRPRENVRLERVARSRGDLADRERQPGEDVDPLDAYRDADDFAEDVPF